MQPHLEDLRKPSVGRQKPEFPLKPKLEMSALQKWNPFRGSSLWVPNREVEKILNRMASILGRNHRMFRPLLVIAFTLQLAGASAAADSVSDFATGLPFPVKLLLTDQGNLLVSEARPAPNTGRISIVNRHGVRRSLMEGLASGGHASPRARRQTRQALLLCFYHVGRDRRQARQDYWPHRVPECGSAAKRGGPLPII